MSLVEHPLPGTLPLVEYTDEQRLVREIAHKERLLATEFADEGQRSLRNRRIEWLVLAGVILVVLSIVIESLR